MKFLLFCIYSLLTFKSLCQIITKDVIVLYDSDSIASTHRSFFTFIKQTNQHVEIESLNNKTVSLIQYSQLMYKNLVLFLSVNKQLTGRINVNSILDFIDAGGNLILFTEPMKGTDSNKLITELGFVDSFNQYVIDHENYVSEKISKHTVIKIPSSCIKAHPGVITRLPNAILYEGKGFSIDPLNPLTFPIITADSNAYLAVPEDNITEFPIALGRDIIVVGGLQARNKARAVVIGSSKIFNDETLFSTLNSNKDSALTSIPVGNFKIMEDISNWTFQKHSVIRVSEPKHLLVSTKETLPEYIVETLLQYSLKLEVLDSIKGWIPFIVNDLQLELIRLTLFSRLTYNSSNDGVYTAQFYAPDFIGTYGLETRYRKLGYTPIDYSVKIVVRPRKHNDYKRFLNGAWPYYISTFLMMILVLALTSLLINQENGSKEKLE